MKSQNAGFGFPAAAIASYLVSLALAVVFSVISTDAWSAEWGWDHNGSVMSLYSDGTQRAFRYKRPRSGLVRAGVSPGTLLFSGRRSGLQYSGTAYLFSRRCGAIAYDVSGNLSPGLKYIRLVGQAPVRDRNCNIVSWKRDVLTFEALQPPGCHLECQGCPGEIQFADTRDFAAWQRTQPATSCPYLYSWNAEQQSWVSHGKVIHDAVGKAREGTDTVRMRGLSTRFSLSEHEPEDSFIDNVRVEFELRDGTTVAVDPSNPRLSKVDGINLFIPAYKAVVIDFELPQDIREQDVAWTTIHVTGYYETHQAANICRRPRDLSVPVNHPSEWLSAARE